MQLEIELPKWNEYTSLMTSHEKITARHDPDDIQRSSIWRSCVRLINIGMSIFMSIALIASLSISIICVFQFPFISKYNFVQYE